MCDRFVARDTRNLALDNADQFLRAALDGPFTIAVANSIRLRQISWSGRERCQTLSRSAMRGFVTATRCSCRFGVTPVSAMNRVCPMVNHGRDRSTIISNVRAKDAREYPSPLPKNRQLI